METIQTLTTISIGKEERIGYITLNRPEKRNALSPQMVAELKGAFAQMTSDTAVKAIVLKAEGKVFCAGADLAYLQQLQKNTREENLEDSMNLKEMFQSIYDCPKPVIAQVHGHAIAGGCGLANVCDFVFAVPEAKLQDVRWGRGGKHHCRSRRCCPRRRSRGGSFRAFGWSSDSGRRE